MKISIKENIISGDTLGELQAIVVFTNDGKNE